MQLRDNPFLVPISRIARPNPFQLMTPATPALMRPNPKRNRRNPFIISSNTSERMTYVGIGAIGAVAINETCRRMDPKVGPWVFAASNAIPYFVPGPMGCALGGALAYSLIQKAIERIALTSVGATFAAMP